MSLLRLLFRTRAPLTNISTPHTGARAAYATATKPPPRSGNVIPTLKQFMLRGRVLGLYREVLRTLRHISASNPLLRNELKTYARGEFERNKYVGEEIHVKYLLSLGERELEQMKRYIMGG